MEEKNKIYVGNLEYGVTEESLKEAFESKGVQTSEVKIIKDKFTGKSKGFGLVEVPSEEDIQKAIDSLDGQDLNGRKMKVSKARKPRSNFDRPNRGRHSGGRVGYKFQFRFCKIKEGQESPFFFLPIIP